MPEERAMKQAEMLTDERRDQMIREMHKTLTGNGNPASGLERRFDRVERQVGFIVKIATASAVGAATTLGGIVVVKVASGSTASAAPAEKPEAAP